MLQETGIINWTPILCSTHPEQKQYITLLLLLKKNQSGVLNHKYAKAVTEI